VVNVVTLHGDQVIATVEIDSPVMVSVTGSRVLGGTVDIGVGNGDMVRGAGTEDYVLAADMGSGYMIDPDHVGIVDSDSITTPDILGVDFGNENVSKESVRGSGFKSSVSSYWMMTLLAPETIRRPLPLIIPVESSPRMVLLEATTIPRVPALSL